MLVGLVWPSKKTKAWVRADKSGRTPLHHALSHGHIACVQYLLSLPRVIAPDPYVRRHGAAALVIAVQQGNVQFLRALVEAGANVAEATANDGMTLLQIALSRDHMACVQYLLSVPEVVAIVDAVQQKVPAGATALWLAAKNGDLHLLKALVGAGASATKATTDGVTPLHAAAGGGHLACVKYLVSLPSVIATIDAVQQMEVPTGATALWVAAKNGHVRVLKVLVGAGASATKATTDGVTPLHAAAGGGHLACVQHLVSLSDVIATIEVVQRNRDGATALWVAAKEGHLQVLKALVGAGANPSMSGSDRFFPKSPLIAAYEGGHQPCVMYLMSLPGVTDASLFQMLYSLLVLCYCVIGAFCCCVCCGIFAPNARNNY